MALVLSNRVQETCTSPGTGAVTLLGAVTGYQTFLAGVGDANTCYYCIADQGGANWEVGLGTYTASGNTLARTTPYAGSSATPVDFSSGTQNVFVTYPASKSVNLDASGNVSPLGTVASGTWQGTAVGISYGGTGQTTAGAAFNALSPITTTGDLIVGNGSNSATRLAIGTNGYVLTSNGTTATWSDPNYPTSSYTRTSFTATGGQTTFSVTYTVNQLEVFLNGVLLNAADYTATNGTTVVLASAASAGDIVETIAYNITTTSITDANNLVGGAAGRVPYQSAAGATSFTTTGTTGQPLLSGGSGSPTWGTLGVAAGGTGVTTSTGTGSVVLNTNPTITAGKETKVSIAASDIDLSLGNYYSKTISGTTTFTVSNTPTTGTAASFILDLTNGGSATVNWWSNVKWAGGTSPTLTASGRDVLGFFTYDAGTTWTGLVLGKDVK